MIGHYRREEISMIVTEMVAHPPMDARDPEIVPFDFVLPPALEAREPPEARGLARDDVRLLVSSRADDRIVHARFGNLPDYLRAGDLLVIRAAR